jgi:hypothetical protein
MFECVTAGRYAPLAEIDRLPALRRRRLVSSFGALLESMMADALLDLANRMRRRSGSRIGPEAFYLERRRRHRLKAFRCGSGHWRAERFRRSRHALQLDNDSALPEQAFVSYYSLFAKSLASLRAVTLCKIPPDSLDLDDTIDLR